MLYVSVMRNNPHMRNTVTSRSLAQMPNQLCLLGVPLALGQSRRGVDMGPSAIRIAGLESKLTALGHNVEDFGNTFVFPLNKNSEGSPNARYLEEITEACRRHAELVIKALDANKIPITLGGDHSIAAGSVSGLAYFHMVKNRKVGLIWIDAHSDINTPATSPSGNLHGMPLGAIMGLFPGALSELYGFSPKIIPENCVLVGTRDVDERERENIRSTGIHVFTMRDIDDQGVRAVMKQAVELASSGTAGYHVSLDMDWIDPEHAPGVGTPVCGGATYREGHHAMEIIGDHGGMLSFEIVEINPVLDECNRTAELAVDLTLSAFGKRIL